MKMKHTPGPWKFSALGRIVADSAEQVVCRPAAYVNNAERQVANARLIAAAPELLAFADRVADVLEYYNENRGPTRDSALCELFELARAAIAKATSRE